MATIAVAPFVLKNATFQVATDQYESNISSVLFEPNVSAVTWQSITPTAPFSDVSSATWSCTIGYAQDWVTANSLAQYLMNNAGQSKVCVFKPNGIATGTAIITATLIMAPGPIGGDVNTVAVGSVTLGVVGVPVKTAAP